MDYLTVILVLSGIGILNTAYLSWHGITGKPVACIFFPKEWCEKVQYSKYSKTFGIPNGMAGLAMYAAIFVLALLYAGGSVSFTPILVLIIFGFVFSMYFTYVQAFILRAFCTWCVISALDFTLMLLATILMR